MKRCSHTLASIAASVPVLLLTSVHASAATPVVSNVVAQQRVATKLMDIRYDISDPDSAQLTVRVQISADNGATFTVSAIHLTNGNPAVVSCGEGVTPGTNRWIVWDGEADWNRKYSTQMIVRVTAIDLPGMELIPAGSFEMGDAFGEGDTAERPVHTVSVSAFLMDRYEVSKDQWDQVMAWAITNGYGFSNPGSAKAPDHPVYTVKWHDCVKWCNARSEREGRVPCYYTDSSQSIVYRDGVIDLANAAVKWDAGGYRLPTEAEWEYAARGGLSGGRFPWGTSINHDYANYVANGSAYSYDTSPYTVGTYHPDYPSESVSPYRHISPVSAFERGRNGYGLYGMAGNVRHWCWDWKGTSYYASSPGADPRGPASGTYRVSRGGSWRDVAERCRVAARGDADYIGGAPAYDVGFRTVLPPGQ